MTSRLDQPGRLGTSAVKTVCAHCGLEVPANMIAVNSEQQFCCGGCRQVYHLLNDWGLENYYTLRQRQQGTSIPARVSGRAFLDFDDADLQQQHAQTVGPTKHIDLYLEGVHCAACVWLVESLPNNLHGLLQVRLNYANSIASIQWDPQRIKLSDIASALDQLGYIPHIRGLAQLDSSRQKQDRSLLIRIGVATFCAMNIMFIHLALYAGDHHGMDPHFASFFRWVSLGLSLPVVFYAATPFFKTAWAGLRQRVPHMDLPIAIALFSAFTFSAVATVRQSGPVYFDSLAALVALLLGARYLQQRAQRAALERAENLRSVSFVEFARRLDSSGIGVEVPISALKQGDRVEVRSGDIVPVDGLVVDGNSALDNAILTGETNPIQVATGDSVHAGATNMGSRLVLQVLATGAATRIGSLMALVEKAMAQRAPFVQLADRISRVFVLVVLSLAVITGISAYLWSNGNLDSALQQSVALLVVTCPCALGLATPIAMTVGLAKGAGAGIFLKNPGVVELLPRVSTIFLDKTGTLTQGQATLRHYTGDKRSLDLAYALESQSAHPMAQALRRSLQQPVRPLHTVTKVNELAGRGILGQVDGDSVAVGNQALMEHLDIPVLQLHKSHIKEAVQRTLSPVFVAVNGAVAGVAAVGDILRADTVMTLAALRRRGLKLRILSGDHPEVVTQLAQEVGIPAEDAMGGLTPENKHAMVQLFREQNPGQRLMMVGDGVNDAAALALADIGVAMAGGAGASIVAADVVITRTGLGPLEELYRGSGKLLGVVRRNLVFSLFYNVVGASLAMAGLVGPLLAAILMPISSLTVILSSSIGQSFAKPQGATKG